MDFTKAFHSIDAVSIKQEVQSQKLVILLLAGFSIKIPNSV
jgi:hypothetical protein